MNVEARPRLARGPALGVTLLVAAHTLWTSASPALAYRLYAKDWRLDHETTAAIFAIYPFAVVLTLALSGGLADRVGRRRAMLLGVAASLAGTLMMALAAGAGGLFAARATMGLGVGLSAGSSTAAIVELYGPARLHAAAAATTAAQCAGFALSLLVGGLAVQYSAWPMRVEFWALVAILTPLCALVAVLPDTLAARDALAPVPLFLPAFARGGGRAFGLATATMVAAMAHGVVILSIGGQIAHDLVGSSNAALDGGMLALFPVAACGGGLLGRALTSRAAASGGAVGSIAGMAMLWLATTTQEGGILALAMLTDGVGYSLLFVAALDIAGRVAPADRRAGVLSWLYLCGYLGMTVFALALGRIAEVEGFRAAVATGAAAIALGAGAVALLGRRTAGWHDLAPT